MFSDDAADLIHHTSRGLPRAVNNLALQALVATYAANKTIVDEIPPPAPSPKSPPNNQPRHGEHQTANTTTKTPPRTSGRGLRHHRTSAPEMTPTSSSSLAVNTGHPARNERTMASHAVGAPVYAAKAAGFAAPNDQAEVTTGSARRALQKPPPALPPFCPPLRPGAQTL